MNLESTWIVSQLGAREHYAIPRALHHVNRLERLITDFWCPPSSLTRHFSSLGRLHERWHEDLADCRVDSSGIGFVGEELIARLHRAVYWDRILRRNDQFQRFASKQLQGIDEGEYVLFSFSYTARQLIHLARSRGWFSIVDQIDPGPEEERIVQREHERYDHVASTWRPAPPEYWDQWHEEMELCDRIIVNSTWSAKCLAIEGITAKKVSVIPLVYTSHGYSPHTSKTSKVRLVGKRHAPHPIKLLFLGQVNLRKGIGRLIDAMRLLSDDRRFELTLAGPCEIEPTFWSSLPNVRWIGPLKRSQVAEAYQNADVFILPTLSDGYALTQLEALSHGLPVIASRNCGQAVQHEKNGLILDDLEPETIAEAICTLPEFQLQPTQKILFGIADLGNRLLELASHAVA